MVNIQKYFPTLIGAVVNPNHDKIEKKLTNECYKIQKKIISGGKGWVSNETYNTLAKHNIFTNKKFNDVNKFVLDSVHTYCDNLKIDKDHLSKKPHAWFNIYSLGDYQEYHTHAHSMISVVYFLKATEDAAKIYFKSPVNDMIQPSYSETTFDTFDRIHYQPTPGLLLIFRSYLEHCVEKHKSKESRITFSYNF